jgi:putative acetyltransferase
MVVRKLRRDDVGQIARLYYDTVRAVNARDYSAEQIQAWAPAVYTDDYWLDRFASRCVFVVDAGNTIAGFAEYQTGGHIDCFYVHEAWQRRGLGSALLDRIEREAVANGDTVLFADVSITARPFFSTRSFQVRRMLDREYRGCRFLLYRMEKDLHTLPSPAGASA